MVESDPYALPARLAGRVCATAAVGQRDLQDCVRRYTDLFPAGAVDSTLLAMVALANAVSAPASVPARLRAANRAALWAFAVDRLVDVVATTAGEVDALVRRCLDVATSDNRADNDSATGDNSAADIDSVAALLAEVRDAVTADAAVSRRWRVEVGRMLAAMAREWRWRHAPTTPTLSDYLANADNLGLSFVFWTYLAPPAPGRWAEPDLAELAAAGRAAQRVVRLVNDLATLDRDIATGDLNVLRLGLSGEEVRHLVNRLTGHCRRRFDALRGDHPEPVAYLERQIEFNMGFHPLVDYWAGV